MLFDTILSTYVMALTRGFMLLHALSLPLLGVLAGLSWVRGSLSAIRADLGDTLANAIFMLLSLVVYYLLLVNLQPWTMGLFAFAADLGGRVGGISSGALMTPSGIMEQGVRAVSPIQDFLQRFTGFAAIKALPTIFNFSFAYLAVILAFLGVTLNICLTILMFHFALMSSTILIPWAPLVGTMFLAEFAFGWLSGTIVRMFLQTVVVGISVPLFELLVVVATPGGDPLWYESLGLVGGAILFFLLAWLIPNEATKALVGRGMALGIGGDAVWHGASNAAKGISGAVTVAGKILSGETASIRSQRK